MNNMTEEDTMTYQEALDKLMEHQRHMFHYLTELKDRGEAPKSLLHGMAAAQEFKDLVDGDGGLEDAVTLKYAEEFNRALQENKSVLSEHEVRLADEYDATLGALKKMFDDPLGK